MTSAETASSKRFETPATRDSIEPRLESWTSSAAAQQRAWRRCLRPPALKFRREALNFRQGVLKVRLEALTLRPGALKFRCHASNFRPEPRCPHGASRSIAAGHAGVLKVRCHALPFRPLPGSDLAATAATTRSCTTRTTTRTATPL